ncbi:MAG: D-alanyl-D-alanine carboxypeptidase, partial [bacterium]|nr:D-alanyl-D-alanine carboxypeptidase [bacterium]
LYPASATKIMTGIVVLESYGLDEYVEVPQLSISGSSMKLYVGEKISVKNLLYGLLINSGNDAAEALAAHFSDGGREGFVERMNYKASEIGLRNSKFENPAGLHHESHKVSAWDLGYLAAYAMRNKTFSEIVKIRETTVYGMNRERHVLKSTNKLLGAVSGLEGVKTGFTDEAGEVLVSSVVRDNRRVVFVVLKSNDRFGETKKLVEWVYSNHEWRKF